MIVLHHQSVVILGTMNPMIHHPAWYQLMSIMTESELTESLEKRVIVTPEVTEFKAKDFSLFCTNDRWQISSEMEDANRIISIAKTTFVKLYHTPIGAYGINHDFHIETNKPIGSTLMAIIRKSGIPFPPDETGTSEITYIADGNDCKFTTVISLSPRGKNFLYIKNNAHFVVSQDKKELFDLGPLLDKAFQINEKRSQMMCSRFFDAIERF